MSFDTTFDFTLYITQYQNLIVSLTNTQTALVAQQTQLGQIQGYSDIVINKITAIEESITQIAFQITQCNNALSNIASIQSLSDADKLTLFTFFGFTSLDAAVFAGKIVSNYQLMLQDSDILSLNSDDINSGALKLVIASLIISARY